MRLTNPVHKRGYNKPVACAAYDADGTCIAIADSIADMAKITGRAISTISHDLRNGSRLYGYVDDEEEA